MPKVINPQTGEIFELQGGEWKSVNRQELAGKMAAEGMGPGEALLVGAGRELTRMGQGVRNIYAQVTGDSELEQRIADQEQEASAHIEGTREALPTFARLAMSAGEASPYLATLPLGWGSAGLRGMLESSAIGGALGGVKYSGDQGVDAITGALLSAAGHGVGALAGRTVRAIRANGAEARAAMIDAANAGVTGKVLKAAEGLEAPSIGEVGKTLGKAAVGMTGPLEALKVGGKFALVKALQNENVKRALLSFAGAGGGREGVLSGALTSRIAPTL